MTSPTANNKGLILVSVVGLALGAVLGMAGSFVSSESTRAILWAIDGTGIVVAAALLAVYYFKQGEEIAAAGYLVFAVAEGVIMTSNGVSPISGAPQFTSGVILWAAALAMISATRVYPLVVRILGFASSILFAITALRAFGGAEINSLSKPLPGFVYPVFVATIIGWIITLLRRPSR